MNGKEEKVKAVISEESAERIVGGVRKYEFLLPVAMILFGVTDYLISLGNPTVTRSAEGRDGIVSVTSKVPDPGVIDRFMASLPALAILLAMCFAYGYIVRADLRRAKNLAGETTTGWFYIAFGVMSIVIMFAPGVADLMKAYYFDTETSGLLWGPNYMILFAAIGVLILDSLSAKKSWGAQQERADTLEEKIQDVV